MSDSEEDDVHFCLRCKGTFIGLDLYIEHRKVKCKRDDSQPLTSLELRFTKESSGNISLGGEKSDIPSGSDTSNRGSWTLEGLQNSNPTVKVDSRLEDVLQRDILDRKDELDQFLPSHDNDPCLKAIDFFSILELQSSKTPTYSDTPASQRGMLTRSKSSAVLQAKKNREPFTTRAFITPDFQSYDPYQSEHGQYLVERDLVIGEDYEYEKDECGALKERKTSEQSSPKSKPTAEGRNFEDNINDSNNFQIQDVHSEVTITSERKHEEGSDSYTEESEEDDEDEYEMRRIPSGGKWKPGIGEWSGTFWSSSPPASHTGGKWKPTPPSIEMNLPSTSTTQQAMITETQIADIMETSNDRAPSPSHTRGKWLPGPNSPTGAKRSVWCGPCNRRLSSSTLYERHCRSDLHLKRTRQEDQLDEDLMAEHTIKGKEEPRAKREIKRTQAYLDSDLWTKSKKARLRQTSNNPVVTPASKSLKGRGSLHCEVCQCRVFPHQIGKHLVSHFHWRRARSAPELARLLALQNIEHIVVQSPFQCATCKFYCNTMQDFLRHWAGEGHATRDAQFEGKYSCAFCRVDTNSSYLMYQHLLGAKHEESVSIIGGSVPIVIQKKTAIQCEVCEKEFLFNLELRKHCKATGHTLQKSTAADRYQEREKCPECSMLSFSKASLQRHIIWAHKDAENRFFCTCCDLDFQSAAEARAHRSSEAHKLTALSRTGGPGDQQQARVCCHCYGVFTCVSDLKRHLKDEHPERAYRCIKCGASFTLKQQVARHVRIGCANTAHVDEVEVPSTSSSSPGTAFHCSQCAFTSNCEAELLFHVVLHSTPLSQGRYQCPSCPRVFTKPSLRKHLFSHTGERPYSCRLCGSSFARKDVLENHVSNVHSMKSIGSSWHVQPERKRTETCDECGAAFYERTTLLQHQVIHRGKRFKCDEEGCVFAARNGADLRLHRRTHRHERPFKCAHCPWAAKTKAQLVRHGRTHLDIRTHHCPHCQFTCNSSTHLKRHLRLHTGAKPYHCPHCNYTCNLLENLRKHVLSTSKHAGKSLYSCPEAGCTFASNTAKDFRSHLETEHGRCPAAAASYVAGLYRGEDPRHVDNPLPAPYRKRRMPSNQSETKEVVEEDVTLEANALADNPTLASAAAPGRPEDLLRTVVLADPAEDVICIQLPPDDGLESLFFQRPEDLEDHGGLLVIDEGCMVEESVQEYRTEEQD